MTMWNNIIVEIYEEHAANLWGAAALLNIAIASMAYTVFPEARFNIFASIVAFVLLTISKTIPIARLIFYPFTTTWVAWNLTTDPTGFFSYLTSEIILLHWGIPACAAIAFAASKVDNRIFYGAIIGSLILEHINKSE